MGVGNEIRGLMGCTNFCLFLHIISRTISICEMANAIINGGCVYTKEWLKILPVTKWNYELFKCSSMWILLVCDGSQLSWYVKEIFRFRLDFHSVSTLSDVWIRSWLVLILSFFYGWFGFKYTILVPFSVRYITCFADTWALGFSSTDRSSFSLAACVYILLFGDRSMGWLRFSVIFCRLNWAWNWATRNCRFSGLIVWLT